MTATASPPAVDSPQKSPPPVLLSSRRRVTPRWWADAGGVGAGVSLLIVTALWISNGGVQQIAGGGADAVSALGRLTGLWGSDPLFLQGLLMGRVPPVGRGVGAGPPAPS